MNWKIEVYSPLNGLKATYTPSSPGGIVNSIRFSVEPSGNCLDGSFEGIPSLLNINVRDIVYIYPDNTTSYYSGYVKSAPNKNSNKVGIYNLEGLKKLIYDYIIDEFWIRTRDGKPVLTGLFTTYAGSTARRIVRTTQTGAIDTTFLSGNGFSTSVSNGSLFYDSSIMTSPDGVATYDLIGVSFLAKLNEDGSLDTVALSQTGTGPNAIVQSIGLTEDGKMYIGGSFTSYNGTTTNRIARVFRTGALDTDFSPSSGANNEVTGVIPIVSQNRCIVLGKFTSFNGLTVPKIFRVNETGSVDTSFNPGTGFNGTNDYQFYGFEEENGKVVIGGAFQTYNGVSANRIVRINSNGSRDATFNYGTGFNSDVFAVKKDYRGRYVIGGVFTSYNGQTHNRIIRLNPDGSVDTTFNGASGFNGTVRDIEVYPDGRILAVGLFSTYRGFSRVRVARLLENGDVDPTFNPSTGPNNAVAKVYLQADPLGVISHSSLVGELYKYLPSFVNDLRNKASTSSGNRGPIVASGFSLGNILDAIVASSADAIYNWGIDGSGTLFIEPAPTSTINFTSVINKQVTYNQESDDEIVTKVKFVFSVPAEYTGLSGHVQKLTSEVGRNIHYRQYEFTNTFPTTIEYTDSEAITYTYEDDPTIAEYGEFTKVIPLALSESWTVLDTLFSGNRLGQSATRSNATFLQDQLGGSPTSVPISTYGDGTFLINNDVISTDAIFSFYTYSGNQGLGTTQPSARFSDQDEVIGMQIRFDLLNQSRKLKFQLGTYYAKALESTNIFSSLVQYEPSPDSDVNYTNKTVRMIMPKAPLKQFVEFNPLQVNRSGLKNNDIRRLDLWLISKKTMNGYSGPFDDIQPFSLKIFEVFVIKLNKAILDSYAQTFLKTPSDLASTVRVFTLPTQNYRRATVPLPNNLSTTSQIVRLNYNISNADGFYVDYVTGYDDQRSNEFIQRIIARDTFAQNNSFLNASGRSVL